MRIGGISVAEREKVIRGLERFIDDFKPFCGNQADWQKVYDAIALLKEREARVLDADEVFVTELSTVLYLERRRARGTTRIVPAILMDHDTWSYGLLSSYRYAEFVHEGKLIDHRDLATYGVTWRCWTARPTEEQRKAVKWND